MTDTKGWLSLGAGVLLGLAGVLTPGWADGQGDHSGSMGFPTGSTLRAMIQGESHSPRQSGAPVQPAWGPVSWGQEGGGETRNPFFAQPSPGKKTSQEDATSSTSGERPLGNPLRSVAPAPIHWRKSFGASSLSSLEYRFSHQPLLVKGRLLLSSTRGTVLCLDAVTGSTLWHIRLPESVWAPGVADDQVYYVVSGSPYITASHMMGYAQTRKIRRGTGPGHLYALSLATGKILWTAEVPGPAIGSPVLEDGKIWVATGNGRLLGFSTDKEQKILEMPLFSSVGWSSPLFVHHWLWVSLEGPTKLVAVWPERKRTVWALTTPPSERLVLFTPTPAFGSMRLVTLLLSVKKGIPHERLAITSAVTGHIFHEVAFTKKGEAASADAPIPPDLPPFARVYEGEEGAVVAGQTAVVASKILGKAMAVDIPSGHRFWSISLPSPPSGSGTVAGLLYILPLKDRLMLVDLGTGTLLASIPLKTPPAPGSPPVIETTLYLSGTDGQVRAIPLEKFRSKIFPPPPPPTGDQGQETDLEDKGQSGGNG